MFKKYLKLTFGMGMLLSTSVTFSQGSSCAEMDPICTSEGIEFTATTGTTAEAGNDYGCLASQPNPSWYYLEISEEGDILMDLTAGSDIDFIIWGPFDDLDDAISNCGTLGTTAESPEVDCSYSGTAMETPEILGAEVGEVYIMLITNYASVVQDVTLVQSGGDGATDCGIVPIGCTSYAGTFNVRKNGVPQPTGEPVYLCQGDDFVIQSNGDYELPSDTIDAPLGDGVYTAQMMWLVYTAPPVSDDPFTDPGYTGNLIANDRRDGLDTLISDINDATSSIVSSLGCGTYYFVPVVGDDGIGENGNVAGTDDNGGVAWDKNLNGCYDLGAPIEVVYTCDITVTPTVNCDAATLSNRVDVAITGGIGDYELVDAGDGTLSDDTVPNGGAVTVSGLQNGDTWEFILTDSVGCTFTFSGLFAAPVINPITIIPAASCPDGAVGNVEANIVGGSGNGAPYTLVMNTTPTAGTNANIDGGAGDIITITAIDAQGCVTQEFATITATDHQIVTSVTEEVDITCFGASDGQATITASPQDAGGSPEGEVVTITWVSELTGETIPGDETNTSQDELGPGNWFVTIVDDFGCEVTIVVTINEPAPLDVFVGNSNEPLCYGFSDGSIDLDVTGGTGEYTFSWKDSDVTTDVLNLLGAGTYMGYVQDENGCVDSVEMTLGQPDSLYADFEVKDVLCHGASTGSIVVDTVYNSSGLISYFWNLGGELTDPPSTSNLASGLPVGTYVVIIQDEFCENTYEFTLTENPPIVITPNITQQPFCRTAGFQSGNGVIEGFATGGVADYDYLWTHVETGETHEFSTWGGIDPGTYTLFVVDEVGCPASVEIQVDSLDPESDFEILSNQLNTDLEGTEIVTIDVVNNSLNFANPFNPGADTIMWWNFDDGAGWILSEDVDEQFTRSYPGEAEYEICLAIQNVNNCVDTLCQTIKVFATPQFTPINIFTPDGDGVNDIFTFNFKSQAIETFSATIVDRWGVVMFEYNNITDGWDGTNKSGSPVPDGVYNYVYEIVYTNKTKKAGQGTCQVVRGN